MPRRRARVLIVENVLAEGVADPRGRTLDMVMLAVTGRRERTASQFGCWRAPVSAARGSSRHPALCASSRPSPAEATREVGLALGEAGSAALAATGVWWYTRSATPAQEGK